MQTFLPFDDFHKSARALDVKRLGKQRVENFQIAKSIILGGGWQNHPAVQMWAEYPEALMVYQMSVCTVWTGYGYKDSCYLKTRALYTDEQMKVVISTGTPMPPWLGEEEFHRSHRSNLLRKDPAFYAPKFEKGLKDDIPYFWPTKEGF